MRNSFFKRTLAIAVLLILATASKHLQAQNPAANNDDAAIRSVLDAQVSAWNRGDIPAFMASYEDSEATTFIGKSVAHGFQPILERYKKAYSTREQMGTLTFSNLVIRLLPTASGVTEYAVVTGNFHLDRSAKGEATKDDGIFSLVWHKGPGGWKILLDHTSS
jgi:ketosteroid isomerase-like protein